MSDVFQKAAERLERENILLDRGFDSLPLPEIPDPPIQGAPDTASDLGAASVNADPSRLVPETRARFLKRLLLRVLRLYTYGQVLFNTALLRVVVTWDERLNRLLSELTRLASSLDERAAARMALVEQRRSFWEARLSADVHAAGERIGALETDFVGLKRGLDGQQKLTQSLRDSLHGVQEDLAGLKTGLDGQQNLTQSLRDSLHGVQEDLARDRQPPLSGTFYFEFEEQYRGTRSDILGRQSIYLPHLSRFASALGPQAPLLDLGCGRGELLELAASAGLDMQGVDQDPAMVAHCRSLGLRASEGDLFEFLSSLPDGSIAAVTALQVIEHLSYREIARLLATAHRKLSPGGGLILETINPFSVYAMRNFYLDPTHRTPVPAPTCAFFMKAHGFVELETLRLGTAEHEPALAALQSHKGLRPLADFLFGNLDYAVIGRKA